MSIELSIDELTPKIDKMKKQSEQEPKIVVQHSENENLSKNKINVRKLGCIAIVITLLMVLHMFRATILMSIMPLESDYFDITINKENDYITLEPKPEQGHNYTLIFLHGAGHRNT